MLNSIKNGIATAIHTWYPDSKIFDETMTQGIEDKCFLITLISPAVEYEMCDKKVYDASFVVQYFPQGPKKKAEIYDVIDHLESALMSITVKNGELLAQTKARRLTFEPEISEGVLTCKVRYKVYTYVPVTGDTMDTVAVTVAEKE